MTAREAALAMRDAAVRECEDRADRWTKEAERYRRKKNYRMALTSLDRSDAAKCCAEAIKWLRLPGEDA